jgi:REP element-mobilizing transposase RayT
MQLPRQCRLTKMNELALFVGAGLVPARLIAGVKENRWPAFDRRVWQRNYYEHVIRDEPELERIRSYIDENPLRWELDDENPQRMKS